MKRAPAVSFAALALVLAACSSSPPKDVPLPSDDPRAQAIAACRDKVEGDGERAALEDAIVDTRVSEEWTVTGQYRESIAGPSAVPKNYKCLVSKSPLGAGLLVGLTLYP